MASYNFVTQWTFEAPVELVWDEIYKSSEWPKWWEAVRSVVELRPGDSNGVGAVRRFTWRGKLPYTLTFDMKTTLVEKYVRLEGEAFGELQGRGRWTFSHDESRTHVRYDWEVDTTKSWMKFLAPLARPLFEWNHDLVMRGGYEGLVQRLKTARPGVWTDAQ